MASEVRRHVIIAANPTAGARSVEESVLRLEQALSDAGFDAVVQSDLELLGEQAEAAHCEGLRAVVAAGGDGTAAAVVNSIAPSVPVVPYPLGTENLLARYLGVPAEPEAVCRIIRSGRPVQIDAGRANGRLFLLMASCGLDADVVRRVQEQRDGHIDHLTYAQPILESLQNYQYPAIRVVQTGGPGHDGELIATGKWAFVINLPRYAGGLKIVKQAVGTDGLLDVCVFKRGSILHDLVYLTGVLLGQHETWSDCHVSKARRLRIEADETVPYQLDGDFGGELPVDIEVLPRRVTLLVDAESAAGDAFLASRSDDAKTPR